MSGRKTPAGIMELARRHARNKMGHRRLRAENLRKEADAACADAHEASAEAQRALDRYVKATNAAEEGADLEAYAPLDDAICLRMYRESLVAELEEAEEAVGAAEANLAMAEEHVLVCRDSLKAAKLGVDDRRRELEDADKAVAEMGIENEPDSQKGGTKVAS